MAREFQVTGRDPVDGRALRVSVDGDLILAVERYESAERLPWLTPGLIDMQVNGFAGLDVNGPKASVESIVELTRVLARSGTTTYIPTVVTNTEERICQSLRMIAAARSQDPATFHAAPFAHLEGPHISDQEGPRGVHRVASIRPPDLAELDRWQEAAEGAIGIITVSPHFPGVTEYISALVSRGVRVSIGHTHAEPEQIRAAVDAGASMCTHLGNGAHANIRRHPNYIWAQLADDRLCAGFIADGHHLPGDAFTAMIRAKGPERSILVSDSSMLAGKPPGRYTTSVGGSVELTADGRLGEVGTPFLAGAARPLEAGVAEAVRMAGIGLGTAVKMATANPGRFVAGRGVLQAGAPADLLLFDYALGDRSLTIREVYAAGKSQDVKTQNPEGQETV